MLMARHSEGAFDAIIPSSFYWGDALARYGAKLAARQGYSDDAAESIRMSLHEAIFNAIRWGNEERYEIPIEVSFRFEPDQVEIYVMDSGTKEIDHTRGTKSFDSMTPEEIVASISGKKGRGGFGVELIRQQMSGVSFIDIRDENEQKTGTVLRMIYKPDCSLLLPNEGQLSQQSF